MTNFFQRTWELDDIQVISRAKGGDGRTVTAYAAVFDSPQEIHDIHGDYVERISRSAFDRYLHNNGTTRTTVLYNHGLDNYGQSGGLASVPIGRSLEIKADGRGLLTVTQYNDSELARHVLEAIRNGDITGYSFRGGIYKSDPVGKVRPTRPGSPLPTVTRKELGLTDYGPTPLPAYAGASIVAIRSMAGFSTDSADADSRTDDSLSFAVEHSARNLARLRARAKARALFEGVERHD